jgi:hypothetical protein
MSVNIKSIGLVSVVSTLVTAFSPDAFAEGSLLMEGDYLFPGQRLTDGCYYHLDMQWDGNLVGYAGPASPGNALWYTDTELGGCPQYHMPCDFTDTCGGVCVAGNSNPGVYATLQTDGNFVVYDEFNEAMWWTGTTWLSNTSAFIKEQIDGNLVIYYNGVAQWDVQHAGPHMAAACPNPQSTKTIVRRDSSMDAPGRLITLKTADSWRCGYACAVESSTCVAWVYQPPGVNGSQATCWLATSSPGFLPGFPGFVAGEVVTCDQNNNCTAF